MWLSPMRRRRSQKSRRRLATLNSDWHVGRAASSSSEVVTLVGPEESERIGWCNVGFLRDLAYSMDESRIRRDALTQYYEASSQLMFLESEAGRSVRRPGDVEAQREVVARMRAYLHEEFGIKDP